MWFEANQDAVLCRDRQGNPANGLARRSRSRTRGSAGLSSHPTLHEPEVCGLRRAAQSEEVVGKLFDFFNIVAKKH